MAEETEQRHFDFGDALDGGEDIEDTEEEPIELPPPSDLSLGALLDLPDLPPPQVAGIGEGGKIAQSRRALDEFLAKVEIYNGPPESFFEGLERMADRRRVGRKPEAKVGDTVWIGRAECEIVEIRKSSIVVKLAGRISGCREIPRIKILPNSVVGAWRIEGKSFENYPATVLNF